MEDNRRLIAKTHVLSVGRCRVLPWRGLVLEEDRERKRRQYIDARSLDHTPRRSRQKPDIPTVMVKVKVIK